MLPRLALRVRRAVRIWTRPEESAFSGPEIEARWQRMLMRMRRPETDAERRMDAIARELNRLGLD